MASLDFIRFWIPQPDQPRQQPAQQQPPPFQPAMQPPMQPPIQPAMQTAMQPPMYPAIQPPMQPTSQHPKQQACQQPMQPASKQPMQDSFSNISLSLDSSLFQKSSTPDVSQLDTSCWLSTPHPTADIIHGANVVVQGQSTSQPATQSNIKPAALSNKDNLLSLMEISNICSTATGKVVYGTDAGAADSDSDSSEH